MRTFLKLVVLAACTAAALGLAAGAHAAYTSATLIVDSPSEQLGGSGPHTITVRLAREDDPTARVVIYVPEGYVSSLVVPAGQQLGTVTARVNATAISPDAIIDMQGVIRAADPAQFTAQAQACFGSSPGATAVDAVWLLVLEAAGQTLNVPVYVTTLTGTGREAEIASAKLTICLPSPDIPPAQGGAQFGAKLLQASMTLRGILTNPIVPGSFRWRGIFTPYFPGPPLPGRSNVNEAGTVEAQADTRLPVQITTAARASGSMVTIEGTVRQNRQAVAGATVRVYIGRTAAGVRLVRTVRTNAQGVYRVTVRAAGNGRNFVLARASMPLRTMNACASQTAPPVRCLRTTLEPFTVERRATVRVRGAAAAPAAPSPTPTPGRPRFTG